MDNYIVFQQFFTQEDAKPCIELLESNHIRFKIEDGVGDFDATLAFNKHQKRFEIQIYADDFIVANNLLEKQTIIDLDTADKEHYLFDFTDNELLDVILKIEEWGIYDRVLARKILQQRGVHTTINEAIQNQVETIKNRRKDSFLAPNDRIGILVNAVQSLDETKNDIYQLTQQIDAETKRKKIARIIVKVAVAIGIMLLFIFLKMYNFS